RLALAARGAAAARDRGRGLIESLAHEPEPWAFSAILLGHVSRVERNRRDLAGVHFKADAQIVVAVYVEMAVRFLSQRHNMDVRRFGIESLQRLHTVVNLQPAPGRRSDWLANNQGPDDPVEDQGANAV